MNMPGFSAALSLPARKLTRFSRRTSAAVAGDVRPQLAGGGFGPTLPTCHWEKQWVVCGSPLPGYPAPMCLEWVYVCKFPGSSRGILG